MMYACFLGSGFVTGSGAFFLKKKEPVLGWPFVAIGLLTAARAAWLIFARGAA